MNVLTDVVIILASIFGLWWGAVWVVESAVRIAKRLGLSELIIGLTVVAIGTSAPEFAVTVGAALEGRGDISVGNVVGSNIFNLGFILGGVAIVRAICTTRKMVVRDGGMLIGTSLLLILFLLDHQMGRLEGGILITLLVLYLGYLIWKKEPIEDGLPAGEFHWWDVPQLIAGIGVVVGSGHFLVESAVHLARLFGVSEWVIGVTIVAGGTSTPEFATSLVAILKGRHGVSAGNLIGSDLFNLLGVLGLAALIRPMTVEASAVGSILVLVGNVVLVVVFLMRTRWQISRWEGALLVGVNGVRWIMEFIR